MRRKSNGHFQLAPEPAIPPYDIEFDQKTCIFDLFLQNVSRFFACHSAACIHTQAGSTPGGPLNANDTASPELHTAKQECRQFLLLIKMICR